MSIAPLRMLRGHSLASTWTGLLAGVAVILSACAPAVPKVETAPEPAPPPFEFSVESRRMRIAELQAACQLQKISNPEVTLADSLERSTRAALASNASRSDLLLKLDYAIAILELELLRQKIRQKEDALIKLERDLSSYRQIIDELEAIGR